MYGGFPKEFVEINISSVIDKYNVLACLDDDERSISKKFESQGQEIGEFWCGENGQNHFHKNNRYSPMRDHIIQINVGDLTFT